MASVRLAVLGMGRLISENVNKCGNVRWPRHSIYRERWHSSQRSMCAMPTGEVKQRNPDVQTSVGDESESEKKLKLEIDSLTKEAALLTEKSQELDDKYKRALADGENMRKRLMKQIEDAKIFGIQGFCKDLLEVADILSKATECVPKEEVKDSNPHLKNLYQGLMMTDNELQKVFKRHGLVPVSPLNEKFNPNLHEALFQQEVKGKPAGTVVVVSKIGYKLHERCIRPALVGVAT